MDNNPEDFLKKVIAEADEADEIQRKFSSRMGVESARDMAAMASTFRNNYRDATGASDSEVEEATLHYMSEVFGLIQFMFGREQ